MANKSDVAQELERLKRGVSRAICKRPRPPQPLFWSLFLGEVSKLKRKKALAREVHAILNPGKD